MMEMNLNYNIKYYNLSQKHGIYSESYKLIAAENPYDESIIVIIVSI